MSLQLRVRPYITQFQVMPNEHPWNGCIIGLADDGNIYISERDENDNRWRLYIENNFEGVDNG